LISGRGADLCERGIQVPRREDGIPVVDRGRPAVLVHIWCVV